MYKYNKLYVDVEHNSLNYILTQYENIELIYNPFNLRFESDINLIPYSNCSLYLEDTLRWLSYFNKKDNNIFEYKIINISSKPTTKNKYTLLKNMRLGVLKYINKINHEYYSSKNIIIERK